MKKAYALALGIFIICIFVLIPFAGAFADSDPGISTLAFNASFGWYSGFPMADSNGYLDINDWSITYQSNGVPASNPSSGDVVYLYQTGDFVEISFNNYDLLSSYTTPIWCIQFGQNPSYSGNLQDAKYTLYQSYNNTQCFYKYNRSFTYDNREIKWAHCFFSYPGSGITKIRIEYDGIPVIWNAIYIKFLGYRNSPIDSSYTVADITQLQASISNTLSIAQLADIINMDSYDIDLSTLETTTDSILQKISNVPDIIPILNSINSNSNNILNAINLFNNYYFNIYSNIQYNIISSDLKFYYDRNLYTNQVVFNSEHTYFFNLPRTLFVDNPFVIIKLAFNTFYSNNFDVYCGYYNSITNNFVSGNKTLCFHYISSNNLFIYIPQIDFNTTYNEFAIQIIPHERIFNSGPSNFQIYIKDYKYSIFDRIELYIRQLIYGNSSIPSEIQQTTDEINQNAVTVNDFQSSTQQSLDNDLQNVPVVEYQIQATSGTQYMKAYSEALFNASNGFRIWYMLPLILFLIGMLIRWGIKK